MASVSDFANRNFSSDKDTSLFIFGLFFIYFALFPNFNVDIVSASLNILGEHVIIKHVLEFPPKDSDNIRVSLESLYGTWVDFPSVKAVITIPSDVRLLFIVLASSNNFPLAPVFEIFSDPAKSTRNNLPDFEEKSLLLF